MMRAVLFEWVVSKRVIHLVVVVGVMVDKPFIHASKKCNLVYKTSSSLVVAAVFSFLPSRPLSFLSPVC